MHAIASYRAQRVETASPLQIVVMLYQELLRRIELGAMSLDEGDASSASVHFHHGREILTELLVALEAGEGNESLVSNLANLYTWSTAELVAARHERDPARARRVAGVLEPLLEGWSALLAGGHR